VLRLPDDVSVPAQKFAPRVIQGGASRRPGAARDEKQSIQLPLLGRIAAGTPIEALSDPSRFIGVPGDLIGSGEYYCLEVDGDSMVDAGILDEDYVIIRKQPVARDGDIVVAMIDKSEATLKRFKRKSEEEVELIPENQFMEPMIYAAERVSIHGVLVGQLRNYR